MPWKDGVICERCGLRQSTGALANIKKKGKKISNFYMCAECLAEHWSKREEIEKRSLEIYNSKGQRIDRKVKRKERRPHR